MAAMRFDEHSLRAAIVKRWGPAGAHVDVFDHILAEVRGLTAERDEAQMEFADALIEIKRLTAELDEAQAWGIQQRDERDWPMEFGRKSRTGEGKRMTPAEAWPAPWEQP